MHSAAKTSLLCSFCRKPQSAVQKLIASPADSIRAYICDECIAACAAIVEEDSAQQTAETAVVEEGHPFQTHALSFELFCALEMWVKHRSLGRDATEDIATMHSLASQILAIEPAAAAG